MLSLYELQKQFTENLLNQSDQILRAIQPKNLLPQEQFNIYRHSIMGALQKILLNAFPVCEKIVGEDFFILMTNEYIAQFPSASADLNDYAKNFIEFISHFSPAKSLAYLKDVAQLEWAIHCVRDAKMNPHFDLQSLAHYSAEQIIFLLPYQSTLLFSPYPLHDIFAINQPDYHGDQTIFLKPNESFYFLIWRKTFEICIDKLTFEEWKMLSWIKEKYTLGEICEKIAEALPSANIENILPDCVNKGWLMGFET